MNRPVDLALSLIATLARLGVGARVGRPGKRPERLLELYEFEACPYCRKVREALSVLDLDAMIHPCPKRGPRFRKEVVRVGGKAQFPYFVDPNSGARMYESDDIVAYLFAQYGDGEVPALLQPGVLTLATEGLASAARLGLGSRYRPAKAPALPLELYSFEASPYCRIVRECLSSLEIPYRLRNVAKGSPRREAFIARAGRMMVPYLVDPNAGVEMFESADIVRHLESTYAA